MEEALEKNKEESAKAKYVVLCCVFCVVFLGDAMDPVESGQSFNADIYLTQSYVQSNRLMSPAEVLTSLQKGNSRFWTGTATRPEVSAFERRALIKQQFPSTAILGCADSRVPCEIVFE